jgi:L-ascorbate metabolism protein UlaG (beta-lactamase superfamily)
MKVKWLGHASFMITADNGTIIITDPYKAGGDLKYAEFKGKADIVTVSHEHRDHNYTINITGNPQILRGAKSFEVKGIQFKGVTTFHDENGGKERGANTVFCFEVDGIHVCHLGDLGHILSAKEITEIGQVDVLMTPVGGTWAIDAGAATEIAKQLKARVIIPMHFRNEKCDYPITTVEEFIKGKKKVTRSETSEIEFKTGKLPADPEIIILKPAL